MSRFLFVVPPLVGHINPTLAVGAELKNLGHEVAWVGYPSILQNLLPKTMTLIPADESKLEDIKKTWQTHANSVFGLESFKFFYADFMVPLAHAMLPSVTSAIQKFRPDCIISDQQTLAGPIAARQMQLPWFSSATTPAGVLRRSFRILSSRKSGGRHMSIMWW